MDKISQICKLLEDKKALFARYEQATLAMLDCGADDIEKYITERGGIANDVDALSGEVARLCDGEPAKALMLAAASGKADFAKIPSEYHAIFYEGQAIHSAVGRITQTDKQVAQRLARLRDEARDYVKQNQNLPKIKKYLTDLAESDGETRRMNEKL